MNIIMENRVWTRVRLGEVLAHSRGYFKLRRGGDLHHSPDHALGKLEETCLLKTDLALED